MSCMCGATDCNTCYPGSTFPVSCVSCGDRVPACYFDDKDWGRWGGKDMCPDCLSKKKEKLQDEIENVFFEHSIDTSFPTVCVDIPADDDRVVQVLLKQTTTYVPIETLLDALEVIRVAADNVGVCLAVRTEAAPTDSKGVFHE